MSLDPSRAGLHINLGNAYREAGQTDKAITELERAIQLDPSLESAYRSLGEIFAEAKDGNGLRAIYLRYLLFMPQNFEARKELGHFSSP